MAQFVIPTVAYLADNGRRLALRSRLGVAYRITDLAMRRIGAVALRLGWGFTVWGNASFVTTYRPDGRVYGDGNPWRDRSPAISLAAAMSLASR